MTRRGQTHTAHGMYVWVNRYDEKGDEKSRGFLYLDLGVSLHAKPLGDGLVTLGGDSQLPLDDEGLVSGLQ